MTSLPRLRAVASLSPVARYLMAIGAAGAGVVLRLAFDPLWDARLPYITFFPAVMLSSYLGGLGPGIVTTVLSASLAVYYWIPPRGKLEVNDLGEALGIVMFIGVGLVISLLNERWRRGSIALADSERRLAQALANTDQQDRLAHELAAIVESSDDAIVSKDLESVVKSWNRGAERMFGYSAGEMIGKSIREIIPEDRWREEDNVLAQIARGEKVDHFETVRRRKDGTLVPVSLTISPLYSSSGVVIGASKIARDISERKQVEAVRTELLKREQAARQDVERASHLKDDFLAVVSHELRTPLNAVLGYAQLLTSGALSSDRERHALEAIKRNAKAQARLVESLLDISRVLAGKLELNIEPLTLASVLEAAADAVRPDAEARGIAFSISAPPAPVMLAGDPARLQQVFWNLFSNAIKFTPRGGRIGVEVTVGNENDVRVTVTDTGKGISPELLPHIFDRFRQAEGEAARGGLGLGLALVREILQRHGGAVMAESEGEGRGSTFTVTLPLAFDSTFVSKMAGEGPVVVPILAGLRPDILVVDDERDARDMLKLTLTTRGAKVRTAASAAEAFNAMTHRRPDILLADLGMPDEDGYSLMRRWRSHERQGQTGRIPAIAVTAYASPRDRERTAAAGFDSHIAKPVDLDELVRAIAAVAGAESRGVGPGR